MQSMSLVPSVLLTSRECAPSPSLLLSLLLLSSPCVCRCCPRWMARVGSAVEAGPRVRLVRVWPAEMFWSLQLTPWTPSLETRGSASSLSPLLLSPLAICAVNGAGGSGGGGGAG